MIRKIYMNSKYGFPIITIVFLLTCSIVTIPTYFHNDLYYVFALQSRPYYFWQVFSGIFEHSIFPGWFLWAHFFGNVSMFIIFGLFIECLLGSKKMLYITLTAAMIYVVFFQTRFFGHIISGSGASGITYAYPPMVLYILYEITVIHKKNLKKEVLFWILAFEFMFTLGFITIVSSWSGTNIYHVVASLIGISFVLLYRKSIHEEINRFINCPISTEKIKKEKWLYGIILLPSFVSTICFLYFSGRLNAMFVEPKYISEHDTVESVRNNHDTVEIEFDNSITEFNSITTSGYNTPLITYSEDEKTVYCAFPGGINNACKIILKSAYTMNGQAVRDIIIDIKE